MQFAFNASRFNNIITVKTILTLEFKNSNYLYCFDRRDSYRSLNRSHVMIGTSGNSTEISAIRPYPCSVHSCPSTSVRSNTALHVIIILVWYTRYKPMYIYPLLIHIGTNYNVYNVHACGVYVRTRCVNNLYTENDAMLNIGTCMPRYMNSVLLYRMIHQTCPALLF